MVAAVSGAASTADSRNPKMADEHSKRTPLLPSEKDNSNGVASNQRKPKSRVVSSRYMSPSTSTSKSSSISSSSSSRKCPSPSISKNSTPNSNVGSLGQKRSVSVDGRRPAAARTLIPDLDSKQASATARMLVTSTRSLSVSFQGESFSLPVSKAKVAPSWPNSIILRKGTPERRRTAPLRGGGRDQLENSRPRDQHRWPARNRLVNKLSRSLDYGSSGSGERSKVMGSGNAIRLLQHSMIDERRPDGRSNIDLGSCEPIKAVPHGDSVKNVVLPMPNDLTVSDSDSVSSGSASGVRECGDGVSQGRNVHRGKVVSARFWQETNSRLRRLRDSGSTLLTSPDSKLIVPPKLKKYPSDGLLSSPQTISSSVCGGIRSASPSKLMTPSRGHSPSRIRNVFSTISKNCVETPSVLSFSVDVRRGKVEENKIDDTHLLRLVYNRHLQWRFMNSSAEAVLLVQKHNAEKNLWNAWITISDLRDTVTKKRHRLRLLMQKLKLASILKGQMTFLEDWASVENSLSISLLGAIEALKASTLRLPLVGGATADVQSLKETISSCVDVMETMETATRPHLPLIEEVNSFATELAKVTANEQALLERCTESVSLLAGIQIRCSSLRSHIIQQSNSRTINHHKIQL